MEAEPPPRQPPLGRPAGSPHAPRPAPPPPHAAPRGAARAPSPPLPLGCRRGGRGEGDLKKKKGITGNSRARRGVRHAGVTSCARRHDVIAQLPDPPRHSAQGRAHTHTRPGSRIAHACGLPAPRSSVPPAARPGARTPPLVCGRYHRAGGSPGSAGRPPRGTPGPAPRARRKCLPRAAGQFPQQAAASAAAPAQRGLPSPAPRCALGGQQCEWPLPGGAFPTESGKLGQVLRELHTGARCARPRGRLRPQPRLPAARRERET